MTAQLEIYTLGGLRFLLGGEDFKGLSTRKVEALAVYLAATRRPQPREVLADLLWDDRSQNRALSNLRVALTNLRKHLGPYFTITRDSAALNLDADVWLDVTELASLLAREGAGDEGTSRDAIERLETGVALYQGEFLQGFSVRGARLFEEWVPVERERLHQLAVDGLSQVAEWHLAYGDYAAGIRQATRWLGLDPLNEAAHRTMMRLLAYDGQIGAAVRQFQECVRVLDKELGLTPSEETTKLYEQIQTGDLTVPTRPTPAVRGLELQEEIGAGAYGTVHRALQPSVNREVAVKVIHRRLANDPDFIRRFEVEAQTVARLEHPYIVPLYDYWRDPAGAYLVMQLLRGGSLLAVLESGPLEPETAAQMLDQVGLALAAAHRQKIVHRDIKPANILFDESGNAFLTDFGIAKVLSQHTGLAAEGAVSGTPEYISPEQIKNEPVSPQTDIYSLGAVLYQSLTGEKPFPDSSMATLIYSHLNEPLPLVSARRPDLPAEVDQVIQRATAKRPADRYADAIELAAEFRRVLGGILVGGTYIESLRTTVAEVYNPYKGLRAFQEADAGDFFGRKALVGTLASRLNDSRLLAVVGPSGSGKSSVVKAGLIPALREGAITGSDKWFISEMAPDSHPLEELELALWPVAVDPPPSLVAPMEQDVRGMLRTIRRVLPVQEDAQLLLVIDQFEELFTLVENEERRGFFIDSLLTAINDPRSPFRVVITLRADFYDRPLQYAALGRLIKENTEVVLPLTAEELSLAVREPAERVGVSLESGLAEVIVSDVAEQPGALPLLQYALTELFEQRQENYRHSDGLNGVMTSEAYNKIGGVLGALGRSAEVMFTGLDKAGRASTRQLFLRLVTLGEGVADTRRRVIRSELEELEGSRDVETPGPREQAPALENQQPATDNQQATSNTQTSIPMIIDTFGAARLLTFDHDPVTRGPTVEVAHEALLREWGRLRDWLNESREDIRQERVLARAAAEWEEQDQDVSYLLRGTRLEQVEEWQKTTSLRLTSLEQAFVEWSHQQRDIEQEVELARQAREARLEQRSRRFLRGLVVVLTLATLISSGLVIFAYQRQQDAQKSAAKAQKSAAEAQNVALVAGSQAALANNDIDTALALAWQAVELNPESALAQAQLSEAAYSPGVVRRFVGDNDLLNHVAVSPDERTMISAAADHSLILWDIQTGEILRRFEGHTDAVYTVAFSPDGQLAVSGSQDATAILWDVQTGQILHQFEDYDSRILTISFSPDGQSIIAGGHGEYASLIRWDVDSGLVTLRYQEHTHRVQKMALTLDGSAILSGDTDGRLILWDAVTGEVIHHMEADSDDVIGGIVSIAIGPDGAHALSGDTLGNMILWNLETGEMVRRIKLGQTWIESVAFMPDGQRAIATRGNINDLLLVDLETGNQDLQLTTDAWTGQVVPLSNNRHVISASGDGILRLWDLHGGQIIQRFGLSQSDNWEIDRSPDGKIGLVASYDGTATLFDIETGAEIGQFHADQPIVSVDLSPDGSLALFGTGYIFEKEEPGHVILWDVETGEEIRRFVGHPLIVWDVEFSPDGRTAVSGGGGGGPMILWDVETGQEIRTFQRIEENELSSIDRLLYSTVEIWDVTFSPDGQMIIAAYADGTIILWDVKTGQEIRRFLGHTEGAEGIVFSHAGQKILSAGYDHTAILWDVQTGDILRRFTDHTGPVFQAQISPDDRFLLTGSGDGTTLLWDIETGEVIRRYSNMGAYQPVFSADGHTALVGFRTSAPQLWRIDDTLDELLEWTQAKRYIPELTCEQRELYRVEPLCESEQ